jgi:hypothetical protein
MSQENEGQIVQGREVAEYADDARCHNCNRFFRRHELIPTSKEEIHFNPGASIPWGVCPVCRINVFP